MPTSKAREKVSRAVKKIVHNWEKDGGIRSSHAKTKKTAVMQAVAISLEKEGLSKDQTKGTKH